MSDRTRTKRGVLFVIDDVRFDPISSGLVIPKQAESGVIYRTGGPHLGALPPSRFFNWKIGLGEY